MIDVRFNNLLLFNLVFSLPLGDEIEPVQRDVSVIIYLRFPFYDTSQRYDVIVMGVKPRGVNNVSVDFAFVPRQCEVRFVIYVHFKRKTAMK